MPRLMSMYSGKLTLMHIIKVVRHYGGDDVLNKFYLDDDIRIITTPFHAFCGMRDGQRIALCANEIKEGDKIWVDLTSLTDGS